MTTNLMDPEQFANRINKSKHWVYTNISQLQHRRIGGTLRFTEADLEWYIESTKITPGSGRTRKTK